MSRFIESVHISEGRIIRPEYHWMRIERTLRFHGMDIGMVRFIEHFNQLEIPVYGKFKWRLVYGPEGVLEEGIIAYKPRSIGKLKLVEAGTFKYDWKYLDRSFIESQFADKGSADDILFVKNGYLTDTSYANILLWDGTAWHTPETPLLKGTQRAYLLDQGRIVESRILARDIFEFKKIKLVNAMLPFEEAPELPVDPKTIV